MSNGAHHPDTDGHRHPVTLRVDGDERRIVVDVRTTLLDALRDRIGCMSRRRVATTASAARARSCSTPGAS